MELDKTKKYDLSQLNDDQLQAVLEYIRIDDKDWIDITLEEFSTKLDLFRLCWSECEWTWTTDLPTENALELFEEETHLLTAQDFVNASKGLAQIGIGLK